MLFARVCSVRWRFHTLFARVRGPQELRTLIFIEWDPPPIDESPPLQNRRRRSTVEGVRGRNYLPRLVTPQGGRRISAWSTTLFESGKSRRPLGGPGSAGPSGLQGPPKKPCGLEGPLPALAVGARTSAGVRNSAPPRPARKQKKKSADPLVGSPGVGDRSSPQPPPLLTRVDNFEGGGPFTNGSRDASHRQKSRSGALGGHKPSQIACGGVIGPPKFSSEPPLHTSRKQVPSKWDEYAIFRE